MNRCLGRIPSKPDHRTIRLADIRTPGIPPPPPARRWDKNVPAFSLGGNDRYGDCVIVTAANAILNMRAAASGNKNPISDNAIIELAQDMRALNGYNILDRLKYWRKHAMWANHLWAYAAIDSTNVDEIKATVDALGVADIGVALAAAWQDSPIWNNGNGRHYEPGSWGLHSIPIVGYDENAAYVASWGDVIAFPWDAVPRYCDEAWALIDPAWIGPDAHAPNFLDLPALHAALRALAQ
jgi:hypothetical protein